MLRSLPGGLTETTWLSFGTWSNASVLVCQTCTECGQSPGRPQPTLRGRYNRVHPYFRAQNSSGVQLLQLEPRPNHKGPAAQ